MDKIVVGNSDCLIPDILKVLRNSQEFEEFQLEEKYNELLYSLGIFSAKTSSNEKNALTTLLCKSSKFSSMDGILCDWVRRFPEHATFLKLANTLHDIGLPSTVEDLRCKFAGSFETQCHFSFKKKQASVYGNTCTATTNSEKNYKGLRKRCTSENGASYNGGNVSHVGRRSHDDDLNETKLDQQDAITLSERCRDKSNSTEKVFEALLTLHENEDTEQPYKYKNKSRQNVLTNPPIKVFSIVASVVILFIGVTITVFYNLQIDTKLPSKNSSHQDMPLNAYEPFRPIMPHGEVAWNSPISEYTSQGTCGPTWKDSDQPTVLYLHLQYDWEWPLDPAIQYPDVITQLTLRGEINVENFFKMVRDARNMEKIRIMHEKNIRLSNHKIRYSERERISASRPKVLIKLTDFNLKYFSGPSYFLKIFAKRIITPILSSVHIENEGFELEDTADFKELLISNAESLTTIGAVTSKWDSEGFFTSMGLFEHIKNIYIEFKNEEANILKVGKSFCETFPNVELIILINGYIQLEDFPSILQCKKLVRFEGGIYVPERASKVSKTLLQKVPKTMKSMNINFWFSSPTCNYDEVKQGPYDFLLHLESNTIC